MAQVDRSGTVLDGDRGPAGPDVAVARERRRRRLLLRIAAVLGPVAAFLWYRLLAGDPVGLPSLPQVDPLYLMSGLFFLVMIGTLAASTFVSGRSPHVLLRPEQVEVRMSDVKGLAAVTEDVRRSLDLFLSGRRFRQEMGGTPRRGLLFEGPPGTGKTHLAKAMAAEAGVPFLFVSATSFQSMMYGATARKIRAYFAALRKAARTEGGAIGFIEEIDAIAMARGGMPAVAADPLNRLGSGLLGDPSVHHRSVYNRSAISEGVGGVVNELLIQLQSFDTPTPWQQVRGAVTGAVNRVLPAHRQIPAPRPEPANILLIAATNRADSLDPALLRPGRFDRRLVFDPPDKAGRRELVDHFLARKAHVEALDDDERRDALAGVTQGYTPVMIEHLLDEALVNAVRRGDSRMTWADLEHARLVTEVGLGHPVRYTDHEQRLIATHEAGHAVMAWLVAPHRRLEVLTIIKRANALGLLAHGDREDVYTRSRSELLALIQIAFGGQAAEEVFFGDITTGPGGDLQYATGLAVQMVGAAGMSDTLISFAAGGSSPFGGDLFSRVLGDAEGRRMVEELLQAQKSVALELLSAKRHLVAALRDALIERHELIGSEITDLLARAEDEHRARTAEPAGQATPAVIDLREHPAAGPDGGELPQEKPEGRA
ncbi:MAG TPA: AAA family ATPase [Kineosporiaceae bacterium]|nr:AAA family ATPase [Kineosporiaceae bacterium]